MPDLTFRPVLPDDDQFLLSVFIASHSEYDHLPLPPEQKKQIVEMQYRLQTADYKSRFPEERHEVILDGGRPVGRVWSALLDDEVRVADMGLLETARNSGIGTAIMRRIQEEARNCGKPLRSSVFRFNDGSLRWHARLGFTLEHQDELMVYLVWRAETSTQACAAEVRA